jgi:P27 family predicted phage terminase small subunit
MVRGLSREERKQMRHRGRKSAAELSVIPLHDAPPKRDAPPTPPQHLKPKTKEWWQLIAVNFELEQYQYAVLQSAAEAWDLYQRANDELAKKGLTYVDPKGMVRATPTAAIARDARTSFLRALRELKLDVEPALTEEERIRRNNARGGRLWPTHDPCEEAEEADDA